MLLLMLFALIAGAGTAITPCVLPVVPALLASSATGGRRRPIGIVIGLGATFTIAIVLLAELVNGVGLASGAARTLSIVVLIAFGVALLIPDLSARIEAPLSRLGRFGPKSRGTGFWSGLGVGAALGFVCAPCAGPILAAVTSVSASSGANARVILVAISYSVGLSAVLLVYAFAGRAVIDRIRRVGRGNTVNRALGVVLLATGVLMVFNVDVRFEEALAKDTSLPAILVDPTRSLESSNAVQKRLASLRPTSRFVTAQKQASSKPVSTAAEREVAIPGVKTPSLTDLGTAPEFTDNQDWFNTPGDKPLTLARLHGHVVLVDFWTYTCINCLRTLPFLKGLYAQYHRYGLDIVGVETPEFTFEQEAGNVRQAISSDGIKYPVVQDNKYGTWDAWNNQYWPAEYLIDAKGQVRHYQFGEGDYKQDEAAVRALLADAGAKSLPPPMTATAIAASAGLGTAETYLDTQPRQQNFATKLFAGNRDYPGASSLSLNQFALKGPWNASSESITAEGTGASISGAVQAAKVYLVLTSAGNVPRQGRVLLDGQPIPAAHAGADVKNGVVTVTGQRLYSLVSFPQAEQFNFTVQLPPGVSAYDFTFG
ncbi:MAG TPA: cytochrome c biogenesis protein CcdA [Solirubrobacteraceae bacterium]|jgi:cytochrome c biogenesis protein CcdA/thiol-disulfide isomerase/thioredoxin